MCSEVSKIQKPCNNIIDVALSAGKQMFRFNKKTQFQTSTNCKMC